MLQGDVGLELGERVARALHAAAGLVITPAEAVVRPSTRPGVDYQCNAAMTLARALGRPPREVAQLIVDHLDSADMVHPPEIAGPGFVNVVLTDAWLQQRAAGLLADPRLGVPTAAVARRVAIDYGSPNVAKEMHIGHLRSSIIGDAIVRMLRFAGHEVTPHNHLGDWGTPFGMLIEHLLDEGLVDEGRTDETAGRSISDLNAFYQGARAKFDADPGFADRSRQRVVALQGGDERTLSLWQDLVAESTAHFEQVYGLLGVQLTHDDIYGESFYNPQLDDVVDELERRQLTELSDGAVCVFPPGYTNRDGEPLPLIIRKRDGGYGYAATDLATIRYWLRERDMSDLLYVVGTPQKQHFDMIFSVARSAGWLTDEHTAVHVNFGTILGADGKTIRTRAGGSVKLVELLAEAVEHAARVVAERSQLDPAAQAEVAQAVGIGAVKYADLSNSREKDYVFTWDKMLSTDGNTSVYLQYANARICSVLQRADDDPVEGTPVPVAEPAERALVLKLLQLPAAFDSALADYAPHTLCTYLFETATAFSGFYESCPILSAPSPELRRSRLELARVTSSVLTLGLSLLGIDAPPRL